MRPRTEGSQGEIAVGVGVGEGPLVGVVVALGDGPAVRVAVAVVVRIGPPPITRLSKLVFQLFVLATVTTVQVPTQPVVIVTSWPAATLVAAFGWPLHERVTVLLVVPPL